jgi:hypothetical protein
MLTYQITENLVQNYLTTLEPYYAFMIPSVSGETMKCSIEREDASFWNEKFNEKLLSRTLKALERAILDTRTKVRIPADFTDDIILLIFYIAGSKFHAMNDQAGQGVNDQALANYIQAHRLFKEQKLNKIFIEVRTTSRAGAKFENLPLLYPFHEKVLKAMGEGLMIGPACDLYKALHNPNITVKELKKLEEGYSFKLIRYERSMLADGALLLSKYFNEYAGLATRGSLIPDDHIRIIYNIYHILGWAKNKSEYNPEQPEAYIKAFRNFIRDNRMNL